MSQNHNRPTNLPSCLSFMMGIVGFLSALVTLFAFTTGIPSFPDLVGWLDDNTQQTNFSTPAVRSNSLAPGASVADIMPTPTPTVMPTATTAPSPTATPLPIVVAAVSPPCTADMIDRSLVRNWQFDNLGCPKGPSFITWAAWQPFEGDGHMLWRKDTDTAYIFARSGWDVVLYNWNRDGTPEYHIPLDYGTPPSNTQAPENGFGYAWTSDKNTFHALGWAIADEKGFCALVQDFEWGFVVGSSTKPVCATGDNGEDLFNHVYSPGWSMPTFNAYANRVWE